MVLLHDDSREPSQQGDSKIYIGNTPTEILKYWLPPKMLGTYIY